MCTLIFTHEIRMQQVTCLQNHLIVTLACKGWSALTVTFQAETHVLYVELVVGVFMQCLSVFSPGRTDVAISFYTERFLLTIELLFLVALRPNAGMVSCMRFLEQTQRRITFGRSPWTSEQFVTQTSTWQHSTLISDRHRWPRRDSNPQSQQAGGRRTTLLTARPLRPA